MHFFVLSFLYTIPSCVSVTNGDQRTKTERDPLTKRIEKTHTPSPEVNTVWGKIWKEEVDTKGKKNILRWDRTRGSIPYTPCTPHVLKTKNVHCTSVHIWISFLKTYSVDWEESVKIYDPQGGENKKDTGSVCRDTTRFVYGIHSITDVAKHTYTHHRVLRSKNW